MSKTFTVGEETLHVVGDLQCPECPETYPETCACGGLIHAAGGEEDVDETESMLTRCDNCGRSEEDL
jgi:hypothetical protein